MIKTKKAIFEWWCDIGNIYPHKNDLEDIKSKLSLSYRINDMNEIKQMIIKSDKWKYPVRLYFEKNNECFRIVGY